MIRVLVVDDSAFMRQAICQMLKSDSQVVVVGTARTGKEGVEMARSLRPDVITLDIEMPEMDGLTALGVIMRECPTRVIMLSSLTTEGSRAALQALKLGAADALAKDTSNVSVSIMSIQDDLLWRVRGLGSSPRRGGRGSGGPKGAAKGLPVFRPGQFDVICIGSSTGGPPVVEHVLSALPRSMTAPIVVAQHMPEVFTRAMVERLKERCALEVVHAEDRALLQSGRVYVVPGGKNAHVHRLGLARWALRIDREPPETLYWPSVDELLLSAASAMGQRALAIILTGIGKDGLQGARALFQQGGAVLAQSEETCVVYGMPKAVAEKGLAQASLTPEELAAALRSLGGSAEAPMLRTA